MFYSHVSVGQFCSLSIDDRECVRIWSAEESRVLFEGTYNEAMASKYTEVQVGSFNVEDGIVCINI